MGKSKGRTGVQRASSAESLWYDCRVAKGEVRGALRCSDRTLETVERVGVLFFISMHSEEFLKDEKLTNDMLSSFWKTNKHKKCTSVLGCLAELLCSFAHFIDKKTRIKGVT